MFQRKRDLTDRLHQDTDEIAQLSADGLYELLSQPTFVAREFSPSDRFSHVEPIFVIKTSSEDGTVPNDSLQGALTRLFSVKCPIAQRHPKVISVPVG